MYPHYVRIMGQTLCTIEAEVGEMDNSRVLYQPYTKQPNKGGDASSEYCST
jgi:hypothetical protein